MRRVLYSTIPRVAIVNKEVLIKYFIVPPKLWIGLIARSVVPHPAQHLILWIEGRLAQLCWFRIFVRLRESSLGAKSLQRFEQLAFSSSRCGQLTSVGTHVLIFRLQCTCMHIARPESWLITKRCSSVASVVSHSI